MATLRKLLIEDLERKTEFSTHTEEVLASMLAREGSRVKVQTCAHLVDITMAVCQFDAILSAHSPSGRVPSLLEDLLEVISTCTVGLAKLHGLEKGDLVALLTASEADMRASGRLPGEPL